MCCLHRPCESHSVKYPAVTVGTVLYRCFLVIFFFAFCLPRRTRAFECEHGNPTPLYCTLHPNRGLIYIADSGDSWRPRGLPATRRRRACLSPCPPCCLCILFVLEAFALFYGKRRHGRGAVVFLSFFLFLFFPSLFFRLCTARGGSACSLRGAITAGNFSFFLLPARGELFKRDQVLRRRDFLRVHRELFPVEKPLPRVSPECFDVARLSLLVPACPQSLNAKKQRNK